MPDARSALESVYAPGRFGRISGDAPGVTLAERRGVAIVQVSAWDKDGESLRAALATATGLDVPGQPNGSASDGTTTVLWNGPARWLVMRPGTHGWDLDRELRDGLGEASAAVVDVSMGRTIIRLSGPATRRVLAKGCAVDLHAAAFRPGEVRLAALGHVSAAIHLVDGTPTADVIVARSVGVSVWEWLCEAAREDGCAVSEPTG
ncbi:N-methylglutamate dehydrogenase subunit D [Limimonas halophila]|uniref:N-methylglutamate dehydrogenase subunit D n=1 Tax=Limimonas halophila TaxID=1082479 RepID=A0A1G7L3C3_9PROT|nr:sarcosine oxidase subunit gamma family protein [Limimonas halophila]SDF43953.1 N-methylglutamate dehydrogenase subunit D [Limimonas halophila]